MRTLHLVRHGETEENAAKILMGSQGGTLSSKGAKQVEMVAQLLASESFDIVFVSSAKRCQQTWDIIRTVLPPATEPIFLDELQERKFGDWENKPRPSPEDWRNLEGSFLERKPPGGESITEFNTRVASTLEYIKTHDFHNALVISHNGFIRTLMTLVIDAPQTESIFRFSMPNAGYIKVVV